MMSKRNFIWGSKKNSQRFKGPEVDSGVLTYRLHRNIRGRVDVQQFEGAGLRPGRRRQKREGMVRGLSTGHCWLDVPDVVSPAA